MSDQLLLAALDNLEPNDEATLRFGALECADAFTGVHPGPSKVWRAISLAGYDNDGAVHAALSELSAEELRRTAAAFFRFSADSATARLTGGGPDVPYFEVWAALVDMAADIHASRTGE